jgi:chorismate mutase
MAGILHDRVAGDEVLFCRQDIDRIDRTILALLAERMRIAIRLGRLKHARQLPVRSEDRERVVLRRARDGAAGPLSPDSAERIFGTIIEETTACQRDDDHGG